MPAPMWKPIELQELQQLIGDSERAMNVPERRLWEFVRVSPTKWQQHPWGDEGGGFWVVGLFGNRALWYNDIELGFNAPSYNQFGTISDYVCNQDDLRDAIRSLFGWLETGKRDGNFGSPSPIPKEWPK